MHVICIRIFLLACQILREERFTMDVSRLYIRCRKITCHPRYRSIHVYTKKKNAGNLVAIFSLLRARGAPAISQPFEKNALHEISIFPCIVNILKSFILLYCVLSPNVLYRPPFIELLSSLKFISLNAKR